MYGRKLLMRDYLILVGPYLFYETHLKDIVSKDRYNIVEVSTTKNTQHLKV